MSEPSPFDIRMNCLQLAKEILTNQLHTSIQLDETSPVWFDTTDVLQTAAAFYAFVNDKDAHVTYAAPKAEEVVPVE